MEMVGSKQKPGLILLLLLLLLFTSMLLTTSFAGKRGDLGNLATQMQSKGGVKRETQEDNEAIALHRRVLRVHANDDYGSYDTPPSFSKPSFKMIPN